jgi:DNA-binding NarL/FixJ family response regulator
VNTHDDDLLLDDDPPTPAAILLVEDNASAAARLIHLLSCVYPRTPVHHAMNLLAARQMLQRVPVGLALVDMHLPDGSGLDLLAEIQHGRSSIVSVVISDWGNTDTILAAIRSGARGYLLKNVDDEEMERALSSIQRGGAPIDPLVASRILSLLQTSGPSLPLTGGGSQGAPRGSQLSPRQFEILHAVAQGKTNREIATALGLSAHTVECHTRSIYRRLAVRSRTEAVMLAKNRGWL